MLLSWIDGKTMLCACVRVYVFMCVFVCVTYDIITLFLFYPHFFVYISVQIPSLPLIFILLPSHILPLSCSFSLPLFLFLHLRTFSVCYFLYQNISKHLSLFGEFLFIFQSHPSKLELLAHFTAFCGYWVTPSYYVSPSILIIYFFEKAEMMSIFLTCSLL